MNFKVNTPHNRHSSKLHYTFSMASLVPIRTLQNNRLLGIRDTRLRAKQFFLLLSWFFFLGYRNEKTSTKVLFLPRKKSTFTTLRAPMAHKTWSKEQYQFNVFRSSIQFWKFHAPLTTPTRALWLMHKLCQSSAGGGSNFLFFRFMQIKIPLKSLDVLRRI